MESQPQNLEFKINPKNFHPCKLSYEPKHSEKLKMWIIEYVNIF